MAALIFNLPNNTTGFLDALRPIKRTCIEENGDLALLLDALDQLIRFDESNPNRHGMAVDQYQKFCRYKHLDPKATSPLRKSFIKYNTWLMELRRRSTMDTEARNINHDMGLTAGSPSQRWQAIMSSLVAGYRHHCFRSAKPLGGRSDNYVLYQDNLFDGKVRETFAVIDSKSAMSRRGAQEPVEFVFSLSHYYPPTPGQQREQPPGFEPKLILAVNARIEPEWIPKDCRITRHVKLFEGEAGSFAPTTGCDATRQFSGAVAQVAREELGCIEALRTVDLAEDKGTLKITEENAEAKLTKETNREALMGMKEVFTGLRRRWQNEHQVNLVLHPRSKRFEVKAAR
jgi:hypothetical protein